MKWHTLVFLISTFITVDADEIIKFKLDDSKVFSITCHQLNSGVTTFIFPSQISGIYGAGVDVKFNEKSPSPFLLSFTPGNSYFTVKSIAGDKARGALNVVHDRKVYVIHLKSGTDGQSSVTFALPEKRVSGGRFSFPRAAALVSLLDKAKACHLIKKHHPQKAENILFDAPNTVMNYATHQIELKEVIRFEKEDVIFFHIKIKNLTNRELLYNPKDFAVNVGDKIFYAALTDASGKVSAAGDSQAWFAIAGTQSGSRNNLSVKNDWKVLLNVAQMPEIKEALKPVDKKAEETSP